MAHARSTMFIKLAIKHIIRNQAPIGNQAYNKKSNAHRAAVRKGVSVCKLDRLSGCTSAYSSYAIKNTNVFLFLVTLYNGRSLKRFVSIQCCL